MKNKKELLKMLQTTAKEYNLACEILGLTSPKSFEVNAKLAEGMLSKMNHNTPLRYKAACKVIILAPNYGFKD